MRSHSRLLFISAVVSSLLPSTLAFGEGTKARFLSLEETKAAFGPTFGPAQEEDAAFLYGISSADCLKPTADEAGATYEPVLRPSIDPKTGIVKVYYSGDNETCLSFEKMKASLTADNVSTTIKDATRVKLTGDIETLKLQWDNELSDRKPHEYAELLGDGDVKITNISAEKKLVAEKEKIDKKNGLLAQYYDLVLAKCLRQGGGKALDESEKAVKELSKIKAFVDEQGSGWKEAQVAEIAKRRFEAAKLILERGNAKDFATATELLDKAIQADEETYAKKAKALYASAVKRLGESSAASPEEATEQGEALLAEYRELADDENKDDQKIEALERDLYLNQMARASRMGADSESFEAMSKKFGGFLVSKDAASACLVSSDPAERGYAQLDPNRAGMAECGAIRALASQAQVLTTNAQVATQNRIVKEQFVTKVTQCSAADQTAQLDTSGKPIRSAECSTVMNQLAAQEKAVANQGITGGNGFGSTTSTSESREPAGSVNASATASAGNGFLNSGVGSTTTQTSVAPAAQQPTAQVAAPTVNTGPRPVFRR